MSDQVLREQALVPTAGDAQLIAADRLLDPEAVGRIEHAVAAASPKRALIDLSGVSVVGCAELAALCCSLRRLLASGAELVLVGADKRTQWVLELVGLEQIECVETVRDGLAAPDGQRSDRERVWRWPRLRKTSTTDATTA